MHEVCQKEEERNLSVRGEGRRKAFVQADNGETEEGEKKREREEKEKSERAGTHHLAAGVTSRRAARLPAALHSRWLDGFVSIPV